MSVGIPNQYAVIDVETTGLKPELGDVVLEVAAQRFDPTGAIEQYESLVIPNRPIDPASAKVHGITETMMAADGRPAEDVFPEFVEFLGSAVVIGHNLPFDLGFLNAHLAKLSRPLIANKTLDTLDLARQYLILPSYSLASVAQFLKVPQPTAHRAMADVETTRQVFLKLIERAKQVGRP